MGSGWGGTPPGMCCTPPQSTSPLPLQALGSSEGEPLSLLLPALSPPSLSGHHFIPTKPEKKRTGAKQSVTGGGRKGCARAEMEKGLTSATACPARERQRWGEASRARERGGGCVQEKGRRKGCLEEGMACKPMGSQVVEMKRDVGDRGGAESHLLSGLVKWSSSSSQVPAPASPWSKASKWSRCNNKSCCQLLPLLTDCLAKSVCV